MKKALLILSLAGLVFSGYMSSVKFFTKTCALGETCPYFLGFPACYFGFLMFLALTLLSILLLLGKINRFRAENWIVFVSALGILFSGYFTLGELPLLFYRGFSAYILGLPTCALGFIIFLAVFLTALFDRLQPKNV